MLGLWEMQSTPLLSSLAGPPWSGVVVPGRVQPLGQIGQNFVFMLN